MKVGIREAREGKTSKEGKKLSIPPKLSKTINKMKSERDYQDGLRGRREMKPK